MCWVFQQEVVKIQISYETIVYAWLWSKYFQKYMYQKTVLSSITCGLQ